ncbi:hypothetical protein A6M14_07460 [Acinetobacter sp. Ac_877]|uniref:hypothetical protein n=1 Tax=Acinetobacter portensis TaxID=1839785 RepID=UPI00128C70DC|nr:hypothetical protein [Acinetobacter portensis]MPW41220.1 hypothetical protein [Acinetobacter portensis]
MKYLTIFICLGLSACATQPSKNILQETKECAQYRAMMTAPMPPSEHEKLKVACEQSQQHQQ